MSALIRRPRRCKSGPGTEDGSIMVLIIGYTAIAAVLMTVGVDVSKVFLARRALAAAADSAAVAAAQGVDTGAVYGGPGPQCGQPLPIDSARAATLAAASVGADLPDLDHSFVSVSDPSTSAAGGTVSVALTGQVAVPFGRVLGWLDPSHHDGEVRVSVASHARSPVGGCPG